MAESRFYERKIACRDDSVGADARGRRKKATLIEPADLPDTAAKTASDSTDGKGRIGYWCHV